jgi:hypothetical protein
MPAAPGMPGQPRQILAMAVKAQVTAAPVSGPLPAAREGAGRSSCAGHAAGTAGLRSPAGERA